MRPLATQYFEAQHALTHDTCQCCGDDTPKSHLDEQGYCPVCHEWDLDLKRMELKATYHQPEE